MLVMFYKFSYSALFSSFSLFSQLLTWSTLRTLGILELSYVQMAWRISVQARTEGRGGNEHVWTETSGILRSALQPGIPRLSGVGLTSAVALNIHSLRPPDSSALAHHGPVLSPLLPPPCSQSWCIWGGGEEWKFGFFMQYSAVSTLLYRSVKCCEISAVYKPAPQLILCWRQRSTMQD